MTTEELNKSLMDAVNKLYDLDAKPQKITINERYRQQLTIMLRNGYKMFWGIPIEFGKLADRVEFIVTTDEVEE